MADTLIQERLTSPVGELTLVTEEDGTVRILEFSSKEERTKRHFSRQAGEARIQEGKSAGAAREALMAYFEGDYAALDDLPVTATGTPFQQKVWAALRKIPAGQTLSYGDLAASLGHPRAFRAVGTANGANPIAIIVPCHRVIAAGGNLGGYGGGLGKKKWLLSHEESNRQSSKLI